MDFWIDEFSEKNRWDMFSRSPRGYVFINNPLLIAPFVHGAFRGPPIFPIPDPFFSGSEERGSKWQRKWKCLVEMVCFPLGGWKTLESLQIEGKKNSFASCCLMLLSWHELIRISPDTPLNNLPKRGMIWMTRRWFQVIWQTTVKQTVTFAVLDLVPRTFSKRRWSYHSYPHILSYIIWYGRTYFCDLWSDALWLYPVPAGTFWNYVLHK